MTIVPNSPNNVFQMEIEFSLWMDMDTTSIVPTMIVPKTMFQMEIEFCLWMEMNTT